jgi:hypothetical protein
MADRYVARRPRSDLAGDDLVAYEQKRLDVIVATEDESVDTGLVDQHGTPIVRMPTRWPFGFCR